MTQILTLLLVLAAGAGLSVEAGLLGPLGEAIGHMSEIGRASCRERVFRAV